MKATCIDCVHKKYSYGYGDCALENCSKIGCDDCPCEYCDCDNYDILTEKALYRKDCIK